MDNKEKHIIALVIPPLEKIDKEYMPNIGIGYLAAALENSGYQVFIFDSFIEGYDEESVAEAAARSGAEAVGITTTTNNRFRAIKTIKLIKSKKPGIFVFVGGRHFHHTAESALKNVPEIDAVVRGEGELAIVEILNKYFASQSINNVKGLVYRDGDKIITNPLQPLIKDLDSLPFPAWHLFKLEKYIASLSGEYNGLKSIGVISSRGCPNLCTFCANASFWNTLRLRSPKNFVDEVEMLNKKYGYKTFNFWDDTMTMVPSHILGICDEIIKRKLDIVWYARARVNTVNENMLKKMKEAGCTVISYGIESGSPRILKSIKKNITVEQVLKAYDLSLRLGFVTKAFLMESFPGETLDDLKQTYDLKMKLLMIGAKYRKSVHTYSGNCTLIYPGTEIENIALRENFLPTDFDWNKSCRLPLNEKFKAGHTVPLYESPTLKLKEIKKFDTNYNKKLGVLFKKFIYHISLIRNISDIKHIAKLVTRRSFKTG